MNTPHITIDAIVARRADLMGQASPQLVGELIDRLEAIERDLLEVRSGGPGSGRMSTRTRLPDGVDSATDAVTGRKVYGAKKDLDEEELSKALYGAEDIDPLNADEVAHFICTHFAVPSFEPALWRVVTQRDHVKTSEYFYTQWQAEEHVNNIGGTLQTLGVIESRTVQPPPSRKS